MQGLADRGEAGVASLAGPVYVGFFADRSGLRAALIAVAGLAALFTVLATPAAGVGRRRPGMPDDAPR